MKSLLIYFLTGGLFTTLIVLLEQSGWRTLSAFMTLMPVFTLVSYIFIGETSGAVAVSHHAKFVLWGTIIAWIPYMLAVAYLSPKFGAQKAIGTGLLVFFVCAGIFIAVTSRYQLFR